MERIKDLNLEHGLTLGEVLTKYPDGIHESHLALVPHLVYNENGFVDDTVWRKTRIYTITRLVSENKFQTTVFIYDSATNLMHWKTVTGKSFRSELAKHNQIYVMD